ncbi:MAG: histidinol dehydrogenase [Planctomycetales bacterium]|nr:histidinol dehydrogenase [Planctomycetales bacterium]NIM09532.1 histidinol dehydrogenase [Planctomycetales bacterium]NIN07369.1 histidinol dehydrogenase [Planctomycetales bacterium]NIN76473.1 histidinol dehydrogenase [Planctomycetales bacterium]NIO35320.1 histidinol dehydrogenase [Planctomycetales bacterium]
MSSSQLKIRRIDYRNGDVYPAIDELLELLSPRGDVVSESGRQKTIDVFGKPLTPREVVQQICGDVRKEGLSAVIDYSLRIDKVHIAADAVRVPADELAEAHRTADGRLLETLRRIRENILCFQTAILQRDVTLDTGEGGFLRQRYLPLRRVGICVPGGSAAYPSSLLMTAVPAQAAGVQQLAVVAPPTPFGAFNHDLLATCHELGIEEVYRMGGAQAVAALAYGVEGIERVDKIVGPGNLFVALAKQHVYGEVDIDSIAGPSEVVVLADESTRPDFAAADLIAQAEHAPGASILVTTSPQLCDQIEKHLARQLAQLERGDLATESLEAFGALVLVADDAAANALVNHIAPEHLHIATADAFQRVQDCVHAGAIFVGPYTPVAVGDYVAGPSHVLPTGGTARFASGLSANDFLRTGSVIHYTAAELTSAADDLRRLADKEGLTAHRASVDIRLADEE